MCSRDIKLRILLLIGIYCFVIPNILLYTRTEESSTITDKPVHKGWATLSGILVALEVDTFADTEWKELALEDVQGNLTVIIGEKAADLLAKVNKYVTLTGVYKSYMRIRGQSVPVLEVRFIDQVED